MLILGRQEGEWLTIETDGAVIRVGVLDIRRGKVTLGIEAPRKVAIHRDEVLQKMEKEGGKK